VRLVLDTNVVVSGFLSQGSPHQLLQQAFAGLVELAVSPALLTELQAILSRPKFKPRLARQSFSSTGLVVRYAELASLVQPASIGRVIQADPDDDHVLACALAAKADLIVSGDAHLLNLKGYQGIPIVSPAEALKRLPAR
jgi:putative PIN family toxin of toxin-antitoxin system